MKFERARKGDGVEIVRVFRATMEPHLLGCVPLGASGSVSFVEDTIASRCQPTENCWWVARDASIQGFCEARMLSQMLFVNYVHIAPEAQSKGLGKKLFAAALENSKQGDTQQVALDVAVDNDRARLWYERLGFRPLHMNAWQVVALRDEGAPIGVFFSGLPQADRIHESYGFSAVTLRTAKGKYDIGRLGKELYRATAPSVLEDKDAVRALHRADPSRSLLIIAEEGAWQSSAGENVSRRIRMEGRFDDVLKGLKKA